MQVCRGACAWKCVAGDCHESNCQMCSLCNDTWQINILLMIIHWTKYCLILYLKYNLEEKSVLYLSLAIWPLGPCHGGTFVCPCTQDIDLVLILETHEQIWADTFTQIYFAHPQCQEGYHLNLINLYLIPSCMFSIFAIDNWQTLKSHLSEIYLYYFFYFNLFKMNNFISMRYHFSV